MKPDGPSVVSSVFQVLEEVGVRRTPMNARQIPVKTEASVWIGSTVTGKKKKKLPQQL